MNRIRNSAVAAALIAVLGSAPVQAGELPASIETYPQQAKGIGIGTALGALVGGPAGAMFGAIGGAVFGYQHDLEERIEAGDTALAGTRRELDTARADLAESERRLAAARQEVQVRSEVSSLEVRQELGNALVAFADGLSIELAFRTGSDVLEPDARRRVERLARALEGQPQLLVMVDGYADVRGDADFNHKLSSARAEAVARILEAGGIGADRIEVRGNGVAAGHAAVEDREGLFFDRRVVIGLRPVLK